jgi:hypothetical protein
MRPDLWWAQPAFVFIGLSTFIVYSTWAALQGEHYTYGPYVSPFYSPEIFGPSPHSWFGPKPGWWPGFIPFSAALFILWMPAGFRLTCYYYRGAYYKAFWADPPACAVGEPRKTYLGERSFPLIMQNIHRYFVYGAVSFPFLAGLRRLVGGLVCRSCHWQKTFGMGLGTLVLAVNVVMLSGTLSVATRYAIYLADTWIAFLERPNASVCTIAPVASIGVTCFGPGRACARLCSQTFMSASVPWVYGKTFGFF